MPKDQEPDVATLKPFARPFPHDLIPHVCTALHAQADRNTLRTLQTVSKHCYDSATPFLYRTICLPTLDHLHGLFLPLIDALADADDTFLDTAIVTEIANPEIPFESLHPALQRLSTALKATERIEIFTPGDNATAQAGLLLVVLKESYPQRAILGNYRICVIRGPPVLLPGDYHQGVNGGSAVSNSEDSSSGDDPSSIDNGSEQHDDTYRKRMFNPMVNPFLEWHPIHPREGFSIRCSFPHSQIVAGISTWTTNSPHVPFCYHGTDWSSMLLSTIFGRNIVFVLGRDIGPDLREEDLREDEETLYRAASVGMLICDVADHVATPTLWRLIGTAETADEQAKEEMAVNDPVKNCARYLRSVLSLVDELRPAWAQKSRGLPQLRKSLEDGSAFKYELRAEEGKSLCPVCGDAY